MRSRYRIHESDGIYFLTCTVLEWIPVFTTKPYLDILADSFTFCRQNRALKLYAYVFLDNHIHFIAQAPDLRRVLQSFKRHTARAVIDQLETDRKSWLLNQLAYFRRKERTQSQHQLWRDGSAAKLVVGYDMFQQKLEYIHNNPVRRGWVDVPEHWRYSSAQNFFECPHPVLEIDPLPQ